MTKKQASFTIDKDLLRMARELKINASQAAEEGLRQAVKKRREEEWLIQARPAMDAHNKRIAEEGIAVKAYWMD